jgi:hypothetical protein
VGPTTSPSTEQTAYHVEYVSFTATLNLSNATSNVLDTSAIEVLEESVATTLHLSASSVKLVSYEATLAAHSVFCLHQNDGTAKEPSSWLTFAWELPYLRVTPMDPAQSSLHCEGRLAASDHYNIATEMGVKAALSDFPQYGRNSAALWTALTATLASASNNNALRRTIISKSLEANSQTFAYINDVNVTRISSLVEEAFPTSAPTGVPAGSDQLKYGKYMNIKYLGPFAGIVLLLLLLAGAVWYYCVYRRRDKEASETEYEACDTPTSYSAQLAASVKLTALSRKIASPDEFDALFQHEGGMTL